MNFDLSKYKNAMDKMQFYLSDLKAQLSPDEKSKNTYTVFQIPKSKNGKCSVRYDVKSTDGKIDFLVFKSPQTLGIKVYEDSIQYDYSISRRDEKQLVSFNFSDKDSLLILSTFNPESEQYEYQKTVEIYKVNNLEKYNLPTVADSLKKDGIFAINQYTCGNDDILRIQRSYGYKNQKGTVVEFPDSMHPDLRIIDTLNSSDTYSHLFHFFDIEKFFNDSTCLQEANDIIKYYLSLSAQNKDNER